MTKENYINFIKTDQKNISEKYGMLMYFILTNVFNVNSISKIVEEKGYRTERIVLHNTAFDDIYFNNKVIGRIECTGAFPRIMFYKRNRKHARVFMQHAIEPIEGVHSVLSWHSVKEKKMHCLAGGETVLHFMPITLTDEQIDSFIKEMKIEPLVEHSKKSSYNITL